MLFKLWEDDVWLTSDTHFGHSNICSASSSWSGKKGTRDFDSLDEMDETLLKNINSRLKKDSILLHAGDWSFGGEDNIWKFREKITCDNIYLTYGNHDHHIQRNQPFKNGVRPKELFIRTENVLNFSIQRTKSSKKETIMMSHYAHLVWDRSHHGSLHVFGHSHASINGHEVGKSMDIGVDNAFLKFGEYRPFHILEVLKILDAKEIHKIDHHDRSTT